MASLCHPWFSTTKLSYRFPIFETSATAFCGTTGILLFLVIVFNKMSACFTYCGSSPKKDQACVLSSERPALLRLSTRFSTDVFFAAIISPENDHCSTWLNGRIFAHNFPWHHVEMCKHITKRTSSGMKLRHRSQCCPGGPRVEEILLNKPRFRRCVFLN